MTYIIRNNKKITLSLLILVFGFLMPLNAQIIHINTNDNSLIFKVDKAKKLHQVHYGKRLSSTQGLIHLTPVFNEAYPSFGNGQSDEVALIAKHADGTLVTDLYYESHEQTLNDGVQTTTIHLEDEKKPFYVNLYFKGYKQNNVIEAWTTIHHKEKTSVRLDNFASASLGFKAVEYHLLHFYGSHAREMQITQERLSNGIKTIETKRGVRTTEYENPSFMLSLNKPALEDSGEVVAGSLAWSGNFKLAFQVDDQERCQMIAGINPFASSYTIAPDEVFKTPKLIFTYSNKGKNQASINLHQWAKKYNLRDGNKTRPIVLNSWEGAYFTFDEKRLKSMIDSAASMGVEIFVLDDGWFGNMHPRNNSKAGLGDWQVNKKKLPNGIKGLIDYTEFKGMKFGIWVEPEMVNPKSELAENRLEWIIQRGNERQALLQRNQSLLDLSNPEVQDFVYNVIDNILKDNPRIAYVKWDANRNIQNFGSTYLSANKQSHLWIEYAHGLENVYKKLTKNYPNKIFQSCASGGGRVEYGALKYTHEFWPSDDTDPFERIFIQWGTNHIFPPIATATHVTNSPNHQTGRETSLKFRFDVAFAGRLGIELSPDKLKKKDLDFAKKAINSYKDVRDVIQHGDLYRLLSPYDDDGYAAINYVSKDKKEAILMVYSHAYHRRLERNLVRMQGLEKGAIYRVEEINKDEGKQLITVNGKDISADIFINVGIKVGLRKPLTSLILKLTKVN